MHELQSEVAGENAATGYAAKTYRNGDTTVSGPLIQAISSQYAVRKITFSYAGEILSQVAFALDASPTHCTQMADLQKPFGTFGKPFVIPGLPPVMARKKLTTWGWYAVNLQPALHTGKNARHCVTAFILVF